MASREFNSKTGKSRMFFRYGGKQFNRTISVQSDKEALRVCALIEETIQDLERGKLLLPAEADPATFILSGGKVAGRPQLVSNSFQESAKPPTLKHVLDTYAAELTPGSKEANSIETEAVHRRRIVKVFGEGLPFVSLSVNLIQKYVDKRAHDGVGPETIRKELATLRMIWGWAYKREYIAAPVAWKIKDLTFPKAAERPPFQTWEQITRRIERGALTDDQGAELWEWLWLDEKQTTDCLAWLREGAQYPFIYPAFAFAAFTGARRSEMLRSERDDWDFGTGAVSIRQKKADKSKTFTRRTVPIHGTLAEIMSGWFKVHPGGPWTLCTADSSPIGPRMATKYFRAAVAGGKWKVLHGWHTFRHSLASNMASAGVDQRLISEILGHHTEEMERRYRHLLPRKQADALQGLFRAVG
jgi:integrase